MGGGACILVLCEFVIIEEGEQTLVLSHVNVEWLTDIGS